MDNERSSLTSVLSPCGQYVLLTFHEEGSWQYRRVPVGNFLTLEEVQQKNNKEDMQKDKQFEKQRNKL